MVIATASPRSSPAPAFRRAQRRYLTSCDFMADSYQTFAADYDWLFDDDVLTDGGAINYPAAASTSGGPTGARRWSSRRPPGSAVSSW